MCMVSFVFPLGLWFNVVFEFFGFVSKLFLGILSVVSAMCLDIFA